MYKCSKCDKTFDTVAQLGGHNNSHSQKSKTIHREVFLAQLSNIYSCKFCHQSFDWVRLGAHTLKCSLNPNLASIKAKRSEKAKLQPTKIMSKEAKEKISAARSKFLEEKGGGGFKDVKWYTIKNIQGEEYVCRGTWEVKVAEWFNSKGILWIRKVYLKYLSSSDVLKTYAPDFYLPNYDLYVEVKGFFSAYDLDKLQRILSSNDIKLLFVRYKQLTQLSNTQNIEEFQDLCSEKFDIIYDAFQAKSLQEKKDVDLKPKIYFVCICGKQVLKVRPTMKTCSQECFSKSRRRCGRPSKSTRTRYKI